MAIVFIIVGEDRCGEVGLSRSVGLASWDAAAAEIEADRTVGVNTIFRRDIYSSRDVTNGKRKELLDSIEAVYCAFTEDVLTEVES